VQPTAHQTTFSNGVRLLVLPMPHVATAHVSLFVAAGSAHESARLNGISHVVEHLVFKGTQSRTRRAINRDAEWLGADINAHTDKDHTAYHLFGMGEHAPAFVPMLADLVCQPIFPAEELEPERQVLLAEYAEDEDDPWAAAFRMLDRACHGTQPHARPVIGSRGLLQRFTRMDLVRHVEQRHCGANLLLVAAGRVDVNAVEAATFKALGSMAAGQAPTLPAPVAHHGRYSRRHPGSSQAHMALGFATPGLAQGDMPYKLAAAVLGEGMSSPLLERLREEKGLAYYAACSAHAYRVWGQFVVEVATESKHLTTVWEDTLALLDELAQAVSPEDLQRAKAQLQMQRARTLERPGRVAEEAALEWLARGRIRSQEEWQAALEGPQVADVAGLFAAMRKQGLCGAFAGTLPKGWRHSMKDVPALSGLGA
jgi:predicted Zn-dependent peptidase